VGRGSLTHPVFVPKPSRPLNLVWTHDGPVARHHPPTRATLREASEALRGVLAAIEAGELDVATPREVALLRRLQGTLVGWEKALGDQPPPDEHGAGQDY
jgi:hypothetical protein